MTEATPAEFLKKRGLMTGGTVGNRRSGTQVGRSQLASDLCQASTCLPGLDQWRDSEGMF